MEKNIEQLIAQLDLDEPFEQEISIRTLIGNNSARAILQLHVDQFYNNRLAGLNPQHTPILLIGGKSSSVHVMARAISNSFGNLVLHTVSSKWLNDLIIPMHAFLGEGDEFSGYYIEGDKLNSHNQFQLSKILKEKKIFYYSFESMSWEKKKFDRLIILSTQNKDDLPNLLLKKFKIQVNLKKLSVDEIALSLYQRKALLQLKFSSDDLISKIAQCCSDIGQAMEVLVMSLRIMRSRNEDVLNERHFNIAIRLLDKNMKAAGQKPG